MTSVSTNIVPANKTTWYSGNSTVLRGADPVPMLPRGDVTCRRGILGSNSSLSSPGFVFPCLLVSVGGGGPVGTAVSDV